MLEEEEEGGGSGRVVINFKLHVEQELTLHTTVKLSYCPMQLFPVMIKAGLGGTISRRLMHHIPFFFFSYLFR